MFWEKWIPGKYIVKPCICGVEVLVTDAGLKFYYTILINKNNKLSILESGTSEEKLNLPSKIAKDKIPLVVSIVGKGLISKKVALPENDFNYEEVLSQNLPSLNINDFYIQLYPQKGCDAYINIIRREQVDSVLKLIKESKNELAEIYLGYSFICDVIPLTSLFDRIITNNAVLELNDSCLENVKIINSEESGNICIEDIVLNKTTVLSFALSFIYLLNLKRHHNYNELSNIKVRHLERSKLRILSRVAIVMAFSLCLINFMFFNYYFNTNKKLETELNLYEEKYQKINELLSDYKKKRHLIEEVGILNENGFTKSVDKIAATIPEEVVLTNWVINPIVENADEDSLSKFSKNTIKIKGNCNKSLIINEWINVLKSQNFIKDINLEKFAFSNEGNQPNFELKIITE